WPSAGRRWAAESAPRTPTAAHSIHRYMGLTPARSALRFRMAAAVMIRARSMTAAAARKPRANPVASSWWEMRGRPAWDGATQYGHGQPDAYPSHPGSGPCHQGPKAATKVEVIGSASAVTAVGGHGGRKHAAPPSAAEVHCRA